MYLPNERQSVWLDALRILYFGIPRKILVPMNVLFAVWEAMSLYFGKISCLIFSLKQYVLSESCQFLYLYIYIGIALFIYCFIACLKHGGITFFISIFNFCSLLRPLFFSKCRNYADRYTLLSYKQKTAFDLWYILYQQTD